jgi:hypothetical protein
MPCFKRLAVASGVLCAIMFVGSGFLFWSYGSLHIQTAFADEQTRIFDEMRTQALQSNSPPDIAGALAYAANYYPSGSKQRAGSRLDRVVERHRTAVVRDIVAHVRRSTGEDLGESPELWIQKYAQR